MFNPNISAQQLPITYYLPDIEYDKSIPTPESFFGYQVGKWHLSHDKIYMYMKALADVSDRITLKEYARSYEDRPLIVLTITSPANHANIERIKSEHLKLSNPNISKRVDITNMPIVVYQGYSVHGNESSGANATPLLAYYLAAAKGEEIEQLLNDIVILLDPVFNPDGLNRFASWVNMHKSKNLVSDNQSREFHSFWPSGRTNHYWFDMNRDWITTEHPESRGRISNFHEWKPNILTDHHEMGPDRTYFFQPGAAERIHPLTTKENQELTKKMAAFHATGLDKIGSLYYSEEGYDDHYYGKGSAYPDANGAIGILFEQASSRGHLRKSPHGEISFPFGIRNQVSTSFSTLKAAQTLRKEFLDYQRNYYISAIENAKTDPVKAYIFQEKYDKNRLKLFIDLFKRHQVQIYALAQNTTINGTKYEPKHSFIIPLEQAQYRFVKSAFDRYKTFDDSVFYDVTSWTTPLAYNMTHDKVPTKKFTTSLIGELVVNTSELINVKAFEKSNYAYLFKWDDYYAPKVLGALMRADIRTMVSTKTFHHLNQTFQPGTIIIPIQNQKLPPDEIYQVVKKTSVESGVQIFSTNSGYSSGVNLGSPNIKPLTIPKILLIIGRGASSYESGEVWHLLDHQFDFPITMIDQNRLHKADLNRYNTFIMVEGTYPNIKPEGISNLKRRVKEGAILIAQRKAVKWVNTNELMSLEFVKSEKDSTRKFYSDYDQDFRSLEIKGTIFQANLDITHPIGFGYHSTELPVFRRGKVFYKQSKNAYANPLVYTANPLISGYIRNVNYDLIKNSGNIIVGGYGKGKVICLADDFLFRAYWKGTVKLFANAVFFGQIIDEKTVQKGKKTQPKK